MFFDMLVNLKNMKNFEVSIFEKTSNYKLTTDRTCFHITGDMFGICNFIKNQSLQSFC